MLKPTTFTRPFNLKAKSRSMFIKCFTNYNQFIRVILKINNFLIFLAYLGVGEMSMLLQKFKILITKYPIVRGMISYSLIWPTSSLIQQTFEGKRWGKLN